MKVTKDVFLFVGKHAQSRKDMWKFVKSKCKKEGSIPTKSGVQGNIKDDTRKANHFNDFFKSVLSPLSLASVHCPNPTISR